MYGCARSSGQIKQLSVIPRWVGADTQTGWSLYPPLLSSTVSRVRMHVICKQTLNTIKEEVYWNKLLAVGGPPVHHDAGPVCVFRSLWKRMTVSIYSSHLGLPRSTTLCVYIQSASHGANSGMPLVFLKITVSMALVQHTPEWHSLNTDTSCWANQHECSEIG